MNTEEKAAHEQMKKENPLHKTTLDAGYESVKVIPGMVEWNNEHIDMRFILPDQAAKLVAEGFPYLKLKADASKAAEKVTPPAATGTTPGAKAEERK